MATQYSSETCRSLAEVFHRQQVVRPMRVSRHEPPEQLSYQVTGVAPAVRANVTLRVERFVGGGFAGQVYRVKLLAAEGKMPIRSASSLAELGLTVGGTYALKIMLPPSGFARAFRDGIYNLAFQGPFSLHSNTLAIRAAALWQKLIRRGAKIRFGTERAVANVLATLYDPALGSYGEISEWIDGRNWRFEVDDHLDVRGRWLRGKQARAGLLGSPEYLAKRRFMAGMVELMHEMGAPELARQYEWWTCKSQPNVLKRLDAEADPAAGLTAVDFRAGLALMPILPMSPADFKLIATGLARGSLVQFDRGNLKKLHGFIRNHAADFADLGDAAAELEGAERAYRDSLPDVAHHHIRLLYNRRLWASIIEANISSLKSRNIIDDRCAARVRRSRLIAVMFMLLGVVPLLGRRLQKLLGRADYRRHYRCMLTGADYLRRAISAHMAETLIRWHRAGRIAAENVARLCRRPWGEQAWRFAVHAVLSPLPARLHRLATDAQYARQTLRYIFARPLVLYFNPAAREQWLKDMVAEGLSNGMLTGDEAEHIRSQIKEPFIQKYLKSLAVHVCTLPVTQIVSVAVAIWYKVASNLPWGQAWGQMLLILGAFQVTPISPGSIVRGLYVVYLVVRERNFRDYNIAVFLGFFKYIGYLAFPVQMAYRYPVLARFMAGHWATGAAHVVPVFGERGALLEHGVFDLFYNRVLTLRRRFGQAQATRAGIAARRWHVGLCAGALAGAFTLARWLAIRFGGQAPTLWQLWWLVLIAPPLAGAAAAAWARGASAGQRVLFGAIAGAGGGILYAVAATAMRLHGGAEAAAGFQAILLAYVGPILWPLVLFSLLGALGGFVAEATLDKPHEQPD